MVTLFKILRTTLNRNLRSFGIKPNANNHKRNILVPIISVTIGGGAALYSFYKWNSVNKVYAANVVKGVSNLRLFILYSLIIITVKI